MPQNVTWNGVTYPIPLAGELNWAALSNFLIALGTDAAVDQESKLAIRLALSTPVAVNAATDYTVLSNLTVPGAVAINLPAGVDKQIFVLGDGKGDALTNNITITPNGAETINGAANLVINHNRECTMLQYHALTTDWKVLVVSLLPGTLTPADFTGILPPDKGGTGIANNAAATLSRTGNFDFNIHIGAPTSITLGGDFSTSGFPLTLVMSGSTAVNLPTTGTLSTLAGAEALTNKDLTSTTNVLSGATSTGFTNGGLVSLPSGVDTLLGRASTDTVLNKTLGVSNDLTAATSASFTNGGLVTLPTGPDTLVGRVSVDVLQNKKYLGGTASATDVFVDSSDTLVNLTALPRISGAHYYDTTNGVLVYDNGVTLTALAASVDASPTQSGVVNTVQQSFGGLKKFEDGLVDTAASSAPVTTVTYTDADKRVQILNSSGALVVNLPSTGVKANEPWTFYNVALFPVTFKANDGSDLVAASVASGSVSTPTIVSQGIVVMVPVIDDPLTAGDWQILRVEESGLFSPAISSGTPSGGKWNRVNNIVNMSIRVGDTLNAGGGSHSTTPALIAAAATTVNMQIPHSAYIAFASSTDAIGTGIVTNGAHDAADWFTKVSEVFAGTGGNSALIFWSLTNANVGTIVVAYEIMTQYQIVGM